MKPMVVLVGVTVPMSLSLMGARLALMADRGWDVHVAVGEPVPDLYLPDPRVTVHVVPMTREITPVADLRTLRDWSALIARLRPTIVVGATPKAAFVSMIAARRRGVPHRVFEAWGARWDGVAGRRGATLRAADRLTVRCATQTVAVSDSLADLMVAERIAAARPLVIGHGATQGVDLDVFRPRGADDPEPGPVVGFVGRLAADKGLRDLPPVLALVRQSVPEAELVLAGEADAADPLDESTRQWLDDDPRNRRVGQTSDVAGFLRDIAVLCFPSQREGLPNAVIEAAAAGIPVVAWDVTGVRDAVVDGVTGYLVPRGDHGVMAARIATLLGDDGLRSRMGAAAQSLAADRFDSRAVQSGFVDFLASL